MFNSLEKAAVAPIASGKRDPVRLLSFCASVMPDVAQIEDFGYLELFLFSLRRGAQAHHIGEMTEPSVDFSKQRRPERGVTCRNSNE